MLANAVARLGGVRDGARHHEVKFTALNLKGVDVDGSFCGYASLFHREDLAGDVVVPGAFNESIKQRGVGGIKLLFQHDATSRSACGRCCAKMRAGSMSKGG